MNVSEINVLCKENMVPAYNFESPAIVKGEGSRLWDADGREYLDFTTGISVCSLGHCPPRVVKAIQEQAARLMHCSNVFCNENAPRLARELSRLSFGGKVFFANSGAEANEGMIKTARLWGNADGGRNEIITCSHSFHGRTMTTLAATGQPKFREGLDPVSPGFIYAPYNDLAAVEASITPKTCAILVEPVQGEGGVYPATQEFMTGLRQLCDKHNLLLMLDEVQTGIGRTGTFFGYQNYGIIPDALSTAKALGNGIPVATFILKPELAALFKPGITHGSTFGGNPLATASALAVIDTFREDAVLEKANAAAAIFRERLEWLKLRHSCIKDVRGLGLLLGIEVGDIAPQVLKACREKGLLVLTAGGGVIRLLPSLLVTKEEIEQGIAILDQAIP